MLCFDYFFLIILHVQNTDRAEQVRLLERLLEVAVTPYQRIRVLLALISSRFDYNSSVATHMPIDLWLSAARQVDQLIEIVAGDQSYSIQEQTEEYDELAERSPDDEMDGVLANPDGIVRIRGSLISFVDRLDDEFTKSLQNIDPHGTEYIDRLKDENQLYCTICRAEAYYEVTKQPEPLARVVMRRLEHIYSKVNDFFPVCTCPYLFSARSCSPSSRVSRDNFINTTKNETRERRQHYPLDT